MTARRPKATLADDADTVAPGVTFLDDVPQSGNPGPSDILACIVCDQPLTYSGKGPKPRYCADHKRGKNAPVAASGGTVNGQTAALVNRAISQLESGYRLMAAASKFIDGEITASAINDSATELAESWRAMLEVNKKFRDLFASFEKKSAWLPVIMAHGDVAASILMSRQLRSMVERAEAAAEQQNDGFGV